MSRDATPSPVERPARPHFLGFDIARSKIDDELRLLAVKQQALNVRRNAFAPINTLAPETLAHIFFLAVHDGYRYRPPDICVETIVRVCNQWRNVAYGDAKLWSVLTPMDSRTTERWLSRSKCAPLDIHLDRLYTYGNEGLSTIRQILTHFERIRHLELCAPGHVMQAVISHVGFSQQAPLLEHLSLVLPEAANERGQSYHFMGQDHSAETQHLPADAFADEAPRLRSLRLSGIAMTWTSPALTGLTSLTVEGLSPSGWPSMKRLLSILDLCPMLTSMRLLDLAFAASDEIVASDSSAQLPLLDQLYISSEGADALSLLHHISPPSTVHFWMMCGRPMRRTFPDLHLGTSSALRPSLSQVTTLLKGFQTRRPAGAAPFEQLTVTAHAGCFAVISTAVEGRQDVLIDAVCPPLDLHGQKAVIHLGDESRVTECFVSLVEALDVRDLQQVSLAGLPGEIGSQQWQTFGDACPRLQELSIESFNRPEATSLITALSAGDVDGHSGAPTIRFPKLWKLSVAGMDFVDATAWEDCIHDRQTLGAPLQELTMKLCAGFDDNHRAAAESAGVTVQLQPPPAGSDTDNAETDDSDSEYGGYSYMNELYGYGGLVEDFDHVEGSECDCPECQQHYF